jgi:flagellar hook protein FlgE
MGLGAALSTAVSGLNLNSDSLSIIGNNLANTNTTAFKAFRTEFVNNFYNTLSLGSTPSDDNAGTNPRQIGQGASIGSFGVDFRPGAPTQTGVPSDLFIQGNGFFAVQRGDELLFTRDGSFRLNSNSQLVTAQGLNVQGFGIDQDFNIQQAALTDLVVPLGSLQVAQETENAFVEGTLAPTGDLSTQGTILRSDVVTDLASTPITSTAVTLDQLLINGAPLINDPGFLAGGSVTLIYTPRKGGRVLDPATITLTGGVTTLQQLADFIVGTLGINTDLSPAGATLTGAGEFQIEGNFGLVNDFTIDSSDFQLSSGVFNLDFDNRVQRADGESVFTQFTAFDSLGSPVIVQLTAYLEQLNTESSVFRVLFESSDQAIEDDGVFPLGITSAFDRSVGNATLTFDSRGQLSSVVGNALTIIRELTGAADPLTFTVNLNGVTALSVDRSRLAVVSQDGSPPGTLIDFGIDASGVIQGAFDNGLSRPLGQVVLARFNNNAGLVAQENNLFREGPNSGLPFITTPGAGVGAILSGALELSNVDIAIEFVRLIGASTSFSANTRVIATTQELFQTLLSLPR